jgi:hypothetical protein
MAFIKWRGKWYSFSVAWQLTLLLVLVAFVVIGAPFSG